MTSFDVSKRTILRVRHGSRTYGTNTPESDVDERAICIPPLSYYLGCFDKFEQEIDMTPPLDLVTFSLQKFIRLASEGNPNFLEVLFVDDSDVLIQDYWGEKLRGARRMFLSRALAPRFLGCAKSLLSRKPPSGMVHNSYDPEPSSHALRILRMCREILLTGEVHVRRTDAEELLSLRRGEWGHDRLVLEAMRLDTECRELEQQSSLPIVCDKTAIDKLVVTLTEGYLTAHG